jgi:hypothetical protein
MHDSALTPRKLDSQRVDWASADFDASVLATNSHCGAMENISCGFTIFCDPSLSNWERT